MDKERINLTMLEDIDTEKLMRELDLLYAEVPRDLLRLVEQIVEINIELEKRCGE